MGFGMGGARWVLRMGQLVGYDRESTRRRRTSGEFNVVILSDLPKIKASMIFSELLLNHYFEMENAITQASNGEPLTTDMVQSAISLASTSLSLPNSPKHPLLPIKDPQTLAAVKAQVDNLPFSAGGLAVLLLIFDYETSQGICSNVGCNLAGEKLEHFCSGTMLQYPRPSCAVLIIITFPTLSRNFQGCWRICSRRTRERWRSRSSIC